MRRRSLVLAWITAALCGALLVGAFVVRPDAGRDAVGLDELLVVTAVPVASVGAGLALLLRGRGVLIGWLLMAQAFVVALDAFAGVYARAAVLGGRICRRANGPPPG